MGTVLSEVISKYGSTDSYPDLDKMAVAAHLSGAIQFPTTSYSDESKMDGGAFLGLHAYFEKTFPLVHKALKKEVVNNWSLLYFWEGSDPSLKPILLMSHIDVVPVNKGTEGEWTEPPYSGAVKDGLVWGRGATDTKNMVVGELEAVEYLLSKGFTPKRGLYLCFGHDEETLGFRGTKGVADLLESRGVQLEFVMDEGGGFDDGSLFGAPGALLATVAVFEKGYADITVTATSRGGHSSNPGKGTSLGRVARAIANIEDHPFPPSLIPPLRRYFETIAPFVTEEPYKSFVQSLGGDESAFVQHLYDSPVHNPLVHTTTAVNMIEGGSPAPNVLPQRVQALINFRTSPSESCEGVLQACRTFANDPEVEIEMIRHIEPSNISRSDSYGFRLIAEAVDRFYPGAVTVPDIVTGGTDCRFFEPICDCCYRFKPYMDPKELYKTAHTTDERCTVDALHHGVKALIYIVEKACG